MNSTSRARLLWLAAIPVVVAGGWLLLSRRGAATPSVAEAGKEDEISTAQAAPSPPPEPHRERAGKAAAEDPEAAEKAAHRMPERVYNGSSWDLVDDEGHKLTNAPYDFIYDFDEAGRALVKLGDKYGYIDATGRTIAPAVYDEAFAFTDGLSSVKLDGKYGFIDGDGNTVIAPQFDYAWPFSAEGVTLVQNGGKYGFVDATGKVIAPCVYDIAFGYTEDLAVVAQDGKYGFIDRHGAFAIPPKFDYAWPIKDGEALVREGDKTFIVDRAGNFIRNYPPN